jgi:hypothetical protein
MNVGSGGKIVDLERFRQSRAATGRLSPPVAWAPPPRTLTRAEQLWRQMVISRYESQRIRPQVCSNSRHDDPDRLRKL